MLISNKIHYFRNFITQMYEKKSRAQTCVWERQVVENLYDYEIDIVYVCISRDYDIGKWFFSTKNYNEVGKHDN